MSNATKKVSTGVGPIASNPVELDHKQTVKYEVARDLLNTRRAELSSAIGKEERSTNPDMSIIERLEDEMLEIGADIDRLDVTDESTLDHAISMRR